MVKVVKQAVLVVLEVTTGRIVATGSEALVAPPTVTVANNDPATKPLTVTVSSVPGIEAKVTRPAPPPLNFTVADGLKPAGDEQRRRAGAAYRWVPAVLFTAGITDATCTFELLMALTATDAISGPATIY